MASVSDFFSEEEKKRIVSAIEAAESRTTGEIRVHLENWCWTDAYKHAQKIFHELGMDQTEDRTGVLVYVAVKSRKIAIIGDKGINEKVPSDFWASILHHTLSCFKENRFGDGVVDAVIRAGNQLEEFFPKKTDNPNELTNEISFG